MASLTNYETSIKNYIIERVLESNPDIDVTTGSPFSDLFVNPMISLLKPLLDIVNRVDITQDLSNASLMTTEELDRIGVFKFGVVRLPGTRASGYVYVTVDPAMVNGTANIVVPPVTVSKTTNSKVYRYSSKTSTILKYASTSSLNGITGTILPGYIADYLNLATGVYDIPIYVEAGGLGSMYNSEIGEINTLQSKYPILGSTVTNRAAFTNGTSFEGNIPYAQRMMSDFLTRNLGSETGYRSHVVNNFLDAIDVLVVGYLHSKMERDTIIAYVDGALASKHIGGKVDLYIRGGLYEDGIQEVYVNPVLNTTDGKYYNVLRLQNPNLVTEEAGHPPDAIFVSNITNGSRSEVDVSATKFDTVDVPYTEMYLHARVNYAPIEGDEIEITYNAYLDPLNSTDKMAYTQTIYWRTSATSTLTSPKFRLQHTPYIDITSITNMTQNVSVPSEAPYFTTSTVYPVKERGTLPTQSAMDTSTIQLNLTTSVPLADHYAGDTLIIEIDSISATVTKTVSSNTTLSVLTVTSAYSTHPAIGDYYLIRDSVSYEQNSARDRVDLILNGNSALVLNSDTGMGSRLAVDINTAVTSFLVYDTVLPVVPFHIKVDNEWMRVTANTTYVTDTALTTFYVTRAVGGSVAARHSGGVQFMNSPYSVTLDGGISASDTTAVIDYDYFGTPPYNIRIDDEIIHVTAATTVSLGVTRAYNGSTAAVHANDSVVSYLNKVTDTPTYTNGDLLKINAYHNKLIQDIQFDFDTKGKRIITTDVLILEAQKLYVYIAMRIKLKRGKVLDTTERMLVQSVIESMIFSTTFDSTLEASDIVSSLYRDAGTAAFIEYIELPFKFFTSAYIDDLTEATLFSSYTDTATYYKSYVSFVEDQYASLGLIGLAVIT